MITKKVLAFAVAFLFLPFAGIAKADETFRLQNIDVNITSELEEYSGVSSFNMLGDTSFYDLDAYPAAIKNSEGLYWGAAVECSKMSLGTNYALSIVSVLNMSSLSVSSGSCDYWLRIPVNGLNVESFYVSIDGHHDPTVSVFGGESYNSQVFENHGSTEHIYYESNGVFVRLQQLLSTSYKYEGCSGGSDINTGFVTVRAVIFWSGTAEVLVTNEDFHVSESVKIWEFRGAYSRNYTVNFSAFLGWGFYFLRGASRTPLYTFPFFYDSLERSSELYNKFNESYIYSKRHFNHDFNNSYITFDFPFVGEDIDFFIKVEITSGIFNITGYNNTFYANITDKTDHLCFSTPQVWDNDTNGIYVNLYLFPSDDILVYGAFDVSFYDLLYPAGVGYYEYYAASYISDHRYYTDSYYTDNYRSPLALSITETYGLVSEISFSSTFQFVDFGWGRGTIYPGEVWFNIYLDNASSVYWSGNAGILAEELIRLREGEPAADPNAGGDADDKSGLFQLVLNALEDVGYTLWDGIVGVVTSLWDSIRGAFEWITQVIIDFVGKIIAYLKNLVQYLGNMLMGIVYVFPPVLAVLGIRFALGPERFKENMKKDFQDIVQDQKRYFGMPKRGLRKIRRRGG